ncbi:MAG: phosphatase PAP2 family protein [Actinobacteria bacterium]|nr:phosphatase PAP2 family protein [Actinomycetota bacterium]
MPPGRPIPNSLDAHWYMDVNNFAVHTPWAHGFMSFYAHFGAIGILMVLLLWAWWRARSAEVPSRAVATVLWAAGGTVVAWIISHYILKPLVARPRPYFAMPYAEVLLHKTTGYSFPSGHATVAGAVIVGLWMARDRLVAALATVVGLLLAFGRIYVGMHYPGDVAGGLLVGAFVILVLFKPAVALLEWFDDLLLGHPPLDFLVAKRTKHQAEQLRASSG